MAAAAAVRWTFSRFSPAAPVAAEATLCSRSPLASGGGRFRWGLIVLLVLGTS